ncbi:hypothetical protein C0Q70_03880 [Pomacea canaliculata]|uniref:NlpC/P60 domain-containing protein n=1 Tax=Pomacea canaliculata TaxID=400727 RepID=A0A2T7PU22_POMCA|nr:hypothetical protein C0Q70_03880 [Pomacea canaliculata]
MTRLLTRPRQPVNCQARSYIAQVFDQEHIGSVYDEIKESRRLLLKQHKEQACNPRRMETLRTKFIDQAKSYFGVPYARKYWSKDSPEYNSPKFLDCCGLIRQVMWDLEADFGFRIGPWNQAYMYDTLPISRDISQMRPGDLVFMSGVYTNKKSRRQRHNMTHVEIWLGEGEKTIGARWNNGKVQVFDSYKFSPKSFTNEQYYFRSIDTWLRGICKSFCGQHKWGRSSYTLGKKSIFFTEQNLPLQAEKAGDDDDDDSDDESQSTKQDTATAATQAAARDNRDDEKSVSSNSTKSDSPEFCDKEDDDTQQQANSEKKRKKKRRRKCRKVSKKVVLPRATKKALLVLEEHIDNILAKREVSGSASSPSQPPLKATPRTRSVSVRRPVTSVQEDAGTAWASQSSRVGKSSSKIEIRPRVWFPLVGSSNSQQAQYIPSKMPQRESGPLTVGKTVPVDPIELEQSFWLPVGRVNPMDRGAITDRMTVAGGMLAVIGSGRAHSLKKNRSCSDLVTVDCQPRKIKEDGSQASLPETLKDICSPRLTFRPELSSPERDDSWVETPSTAAGYSSDEEDSEDNDRTSLACNSDCCASSSENLDLDLDDIWDGNDEDEDKDSPRWPSDETYGALACRPRWRPLESLSDSEQSFQISSRSWVTQAESRSLMDDDDNSLPGCNEKTAIGDDLHNFFLQAVGKDQQLPLRGAAPVCTIATDEPQDGDCKTTGGADGQSASGASGAQLSAHVPRARGVGVTTVFKAIEVFTCLSECRNALMGDDSEVEKKKLPDPFDRRSATMTAAERRRSCSQLARPWNFDPAAEDDSRKQRQTTLENMDFNVRS